MPLDHVPQTLIDAFLSTEDRRFFSHGGFDVRGLLRALAANLRAGGVKQGGSTITQQVAKAFLSSERTWSRKIKELIFARRLEAKYSKREILSLYLNHIFLGNGAYGVQAAARKYFDKDVAELDLGQQALIAGLAQAPSRYSPFVDEDAAYKRRGEVLDNMVENGALTRADADKWKQAPLPAAAAARLFPRGHALLLGAGAARSGQAARAEGVLRRRLSRRDHGAAVRRRAGARTTSITRRASSTSARAGAAPRRGSTTPRRPSSASARCALYGKGPLVEGKLYLGLVEKVAAQGAAVRVGGKLYLLPLENMTWAAPYSASDATNDKQITAASEALKKHDVVWVRWTWHSRIPRFTDFIYDEQGEATWVPEQLEPKKPPKTQELTLEQTPRVQGSIYAFDHRDGYVLAMAGGDDFDRSRVQPRDAGVPPAGLGVQAHLLLARARSRLRLRHDVERQAQGRDRSDDGRAVDSAERRRQLHGGGVARARAGVVEEPAVGRDLPHPRHARTSRSGRTGSASPRRSSPTRSAKKSSARRWRWAPRACTWTT